MRSQSRILAALMVALVLSLVVVGSVFAAGPYASAIAAGTADATTDFQGSVGDIFPVLLGLAVIGLIARRTLRFVK